MCSLFRKALLMSTAIHRLALMFASFLSYAVHLSQLNLLTVFGHPSW